MDDIEFVPIVPSDRDYVYIRFWQQVHLATLNELNRSMVHGYYLGKTEKQPNLEMLDSP